MVAVVEPLELSCSETEPPNSYQATDSAVLRRVQWREDTVEPEETLSARRRAIQRLQMVFSWTDNPMEAFARRRARSWADQWQGGSPAGWQNDESLAQSDESLRLCIKWAALLPATCLHDLQHTLYQLHLGRCRSNRWIALQPPVIIDVRSVYDEMPGEYRWWHVKLNYVLTFATIAPSQRSNGLLQGRPLDLRGVIQVLIASKGADDLAPLRAYVANANDVVVVPAGLLLPDLVPVPTNVQSVFPRTYYTRAPLPPQLRLERVPCVTVESKITWQRCLHALADYNRGQPLLLELISEGLLYF